MNAGPARDFCKEGAQLSDANLKLIVGFGDRARGLSGNEGIATITTKAEL
jgi:hypothetical protein